LKEYYPEEQFDVWHRKFHPQFWHLLWFTKIVHFEDLFLFQDSPTCYVTCLCFWLPLVGWCCGSSTEPAIRLIVSDIYKAYDKNLMLGIDITRATQGQAATKTEQ